MEADPCGPSRRRFCGVWSPSCPRLSGARQDAPFFTFLVSPSYTSPSPLRQIVAGVSAETLVANRRISHLHDRVLDSLKALLPYVFFLVSVPPFTVISKHLR